MTLENEDIHMLFTELDTHILKGLRELDLKAVKLGALPQDIAPIYHSIAAKIFGLLLRSLPEEARTKCIDKFMESVYKYMNKTDTL